MLPDIEVENTRHNISIQSLGYGVFLLRGHKEGERYGDDILWVCTAYLRGDKAFLIGMMAGEGFSIRHYKGIRLWMIEKGIEECVWERSRCGEFVQYNEGKG